MMMDKTDILDWLRTTDADRLDALWRDADRVRGEQIGQDVFLRGLIEVSNYCSRACGYCGLRAANTSVRRYRMTEDEILTAARLAQEYAYGTVVLQAGEDPYLTRDRVAGWIRRIKRETNQAVTLSLGEQSRDTYAAWRDAGAARFLLRFETSNPTLFAHIHPPRNAETPADRLAMLGELRQLGYEVGSGVMIGIPGQTWDDLANDIALFSHLDLHMIGVGPFVAHDDTPLGQEAARAPASASQVPATFEVACKVIALARLTCPDVNIPSTTALATIQEGGRVIGLQRGANIIMPNLTPAAYRAMYSIYPEKASSTETPSETDAIARAQLASLDRPIGVGAGASLHYQNDPNA